MNQLKSPSFINNYNDNSFIKKNYSGHSILSNNSINKINKNNKDNSPLISSLLINANSNPHNQLKSRNLATNGNSKLDNTFITRTYDNNNRELSVLNKISNAKFLLNDNTKKADNINQFSSYNDLSARIDYNLSKIDSRRSLEIKEKINNNNFNKTIETRISSVSIEKKEINNSLRNKINNITVVTDSFKKEFINNYTNNINRINKSFLTNEELKNHTSKLKITENKNKNNINGNACLNNNNEKNKVKTELEKIKIKLNSVNFNNVSKLDIKNIRNTKNDATCFNNNIKDHNFNQLNNNNSNNTSRFKILANKTQSKLLSENIISYDSIDIANQRNENNRSPVKDKNSGIKSNVKIDNTTNNENLKLKINKQHQHESIMLNTNQFNHDNKFLNKMVKQVINEYSSPTDKKKINILNPDKISLSNLNSLNYNDNKNSKYDDFKNKFNIYKDSKNKNMFNTIDKCVLSKENNVSYITKYVKGEKPDFFKQQLDKQFEENYYKSKNINNTNTNMNTKAYCSVNKNISKESSSVFKGSMLGMDNKVYSNIKMIKEISNEIEMFDSVNNITGLAKNYKDFNFRNDSNRRYKSIDYNNYRSDLKESIFNSGNIGEYNNNKKNTSNKFNSNRTEVNIFYNNSNTTQRIKNNKPLIHSYLSNNNNNINTKKNSSKYVSSSNFNDIVNDINKVFSTIDHSSRINKNLKNNNDNKSKINQCFENKGKLLLENKSVNSLFDKRNNNNDDNTQNYSLFSSKYSSLTDFKQNNLSKINNNVSLDKHSRNNIKSFVNSKHHGNESLFDTIISANIKNRNDNDKCVALKNNNSIISNSNVSNIAFKSTDFSVFESIEKIDKKNKEKVSFKLVSNTRNSNNNKSLIGIKKDSNHFNSYGNNTNKTGFKDLYENMKERSSKTLINAKALI